MKPRIVFHYCQHHALFILYVQHTAPQDYIEVSVMHFLLSSINHYAPKNCLIMLIAKMEPLCSKLCWHNVPRPVADPAVVLLVHVNHPF